jgi:hypothetical protein
VDPGHRYVLEGLLAHSALVISFAPAIDSHSELQVGTAAKFKEVFSLQCFKLHLNLMINKILHVFVVA